MGHYDNHIDRACDRCDLKLGEYMRTLWRFIAAFFKWTWRLLNFVREMVLNLFFIFLVLVGVGIWMQVSGGD
ncbi:hypothetical protein ACLB1Q_03405 [Escherichia coli]